MGEFGLEVLLRGGQGGVLGVEGGEFGVVGVDQLVELGGECVGEVGEEGILFGIAWDGWGGDVSGCAGLEGQIEG